MDNDMYLNFFATPWISSDSVIERQRWSSPGELLSLARLVLDR